jgi:hypothetical protein
MEQKNKYAQRPKISEANFRQLVRLFAANLDGYQIAELAHSNCDTVNRYLLAIRQRIATYCENTSPLWATKNTSVLITGIMNSHEVTLTSMVLKGFGVIQKADSNDSKVYPNPLSIFTLKSTSSVSTTRIKIFIFSSLISFVLIPCSNHDPFF